MGKINSFNMSSYWEKLSNNYLDTDKFGWGAVCYTGMPFWFNQFFDYYQKKSFYGLLKNIEFDFKDKDILDVGCGVGRWVDVFYKFGGKITGIDIDSKRLEKAKENLEYADQSKIDLQQMRADKMSFKENSFDFINSITVLQHIPLYRKRFSN